MDEIKKPVAEMQKDLPPKTTTQHSHTSGYEPGDEKEKDAPVEKVQKCRMLERFLKTNQKMVL